MSMPMDDAGWADRRYIESCGAEQFFTDMERYEEHIGRDWTEIVKEEGLSLESIHNRAIETLKD